MVAVKEWSIAKTIFGFALCAVVLGVAHPPMRSSRGNSRVGEIGFKPS